MGNEPISSQHASRADELAFTLTILSDNPIGVNLRVRLDWLVGAPGEGAKTKYLESAKENKLAGRGRPTEPGRRGAAAGPLRISILELQRAGELQRAHEAAPCKTCNLTRAGTLDVAIGSA